MKVVITAFFLVNVLAWATSAGGQAPPQPGYGAQPYGQVPQPGYGPPR